MRTRVEELFHEVADLSADARDQYFTRYDIDTSTRKEVEVLLAFDAGATASLERQVGQAAQLALARIEPQDLLCGSYRLGELLGRGGMGTVHIAERVDGELAHRVAVKLLRPGADDPQLRHRFLAERQILATLSHPNIARLLDAGHREDGRPYLVMEYVDGEPIDVYAKGLGIREKLKLFLKVCSAVGYLHRNLVVHRDLKPANILVTAEGEPKLLDFGISKMLDFAADATVTGMRMLTPAYASPEQVAGSAVSTASDVYSLGAVLYQLLTGRLPHQFDGDSAAAIAMAIAGGRIRQPGRLVPGLRGDLETVLMKALRTDPAERYATVEQFADDLENFLESRPIRARRGEMWYRTRKFLRRHWLPVATATLAVATLVAGIVVANHQRAIAQHRFVQVRQLANKLFDIDAEVRKSPGTTKASQLIVETSLDYLRRLAAEVHGDPELSLEIGSAYIRVARVQGVPIANNLGQMDKAEENLRIAGGFIGAVLQAQPANRTAILRSAQIAHDRMLLARFGGRYDEAPELARESARWLDRYQAGAGDVAEATAILNTYLNVADQHMLGEQYEQALRLCSRGEELSTLLGRPANIGTFLETSAEAYRRQGDLDHALAEIRDAVARLDPGPGGSEQARMMNFTLALIKQARILGEDNGISLDRPKEAMDVVERAFQIADDYTHRDPHDQSSRGRLAMAGLLWAGILRHSDPARAVAIYDHTFHHLAEIENNPSFRRFEVNALAGSTYPLRRLNRQADVRHQLDEAFARLSAVKLYPADRIKPGSEVDEALCALANDAAARGEVARAADLYEELLRKVLAYGAKPGTSLKDAVDVSRIYTAAAAFSRSAGRIDRASVLETQRRDLWQRWDASLPRNGFVHRQGELAENAPGAGAAENSSLPR